MIQEHKERKRRTADPVCEDGEKCFEGCGVPENRLEAFEEKCLAGLSAPIELQPLEFGGPQASGKDAGCSDPGQSGTERSCSDEDHQRRKIYSYPSRRRRGGQRRDIHIKEEQ